MADRTQDFIALPEELKKINAALTEMNEVITGGTFSQDDIWGASAAADVKTHMAGLTVDANLKEQINKLLKGIPGTDEVGKAVQTVLEGVHKAVAEIQKVNDELAIGDRMEAFKKLNQDHPAGSYDPGADPTKGFGFFPAIEGILNNTLGTNADLDAIMGPLEKVAAIAAGGQAVLVFTDYTAASFTLLQKALDTK